MEAVENKNNKVLFTKKQNTNTDLNDTCNNISINANIPQKVLHCRLIYLANTCNDLNQKENSQVSKQQKSRAKKLYL